MAERILPRGLRRVLDLIEAAPGRAYSVGELARMAGVAPRTLQKHFRRFLGRTPRATLREASLARARRELRAGPGDSVTEIALRCGFNHFGRFSADYRARYGEVPSATLRRRRVLGPAAASLFPSGPERPGIAILPLQCLGGVERRALAVAEELVNSLARMRAVAVVEPAAARYHLRGAVREDNGRVRVTLRLVDVATGRLLWAGRDDGALDQSDEFEERIALAVSRIVEPVVRAAEIERAQGKEIEELTAYELTMRALPGAMALEPAADAAALELLDRAMELAPDYARPLALASWCHAQRSAHHFTAAPAQERAKALALAERAARLDRGDVLALTVLSGAYTLAHDLDAADALIARALRLDGSLSWAWARSGWIHSYRGAVRESRECFQIALELAPDDPMTFLSHIGLAAASFHEARYAEAARWFARGIAEHPQAVWANRFLAAALALSGRGDEARRSLASLMRAFPDQTIAQVRTGLPFQTDYLDRISEGLQHLGMKPD